ncbi:hypothetical protein [Acinetobacter gyllenbergii]|uniref:hypothetical protein n=1 Tax=Acinetobacter gyllenbergii TaxID=134534 RepID=UPI000806D64F|nr:hypothetical protein [Acinetobacter gyllenbergii]OBY75494.1 hypothetical protein NG55_02120 [Acinetobacter gyllenbergii]
MKNFNVLEQEYLKLLSKVDESFFNVVHEYSKWKEGLSGLFLASEPDNYWIAKNRIMIVGAETRGWNIKLDQVYALDHYILKSIEKNKNFFQKMMLEPRTKKITFHDFTRAVADRSGVEGLIYSNLFCFAWKEKSPIKSKYFEQIKDISFELLNAQIEYFEPNIIIFANGSQNTTYRRAFFNPDLYSKGQDYREHGVDKTQLYKFMYDEKYLCYRIQHPSTIRGKRAALTARNKLLELLPEL